MQDILRKMRSSICLIIPIVILGLTGCQSLNVQNTAQKTLSPPTDSCSQYSPELKKGLTTVTSETIDPSKIVRGQKVYVPFYSRLYEPSGSGSINLAGTLSIRNTSETEKIRITRVHYFNTSGELKYQCLEGNHIILSPLATAEFGITRQDESGGSGANFIVEWVSEKSFSDPVVEAIIITPAGTQGYSFVSSGRVIEELGVADLRYQTNNN